MNLENPFSALCYEQARLMGVQAAAKRKMEALTPEIERAQLREIPHRARLRGAEELTQVLTERHAKADADYQEASRVLALVETEIERMEQERNRQEIARMATESAARARH